MNQDVLLKKAYICTTTLTSHVLNLSITQLIKTEHSGFQPEFSDVERDSDVVKWDHNMRNEHSVSKSVPPAFTGDDGHLWRVETKIYF